MEEGVLVLVDQGRDREGSRQEMEGWGRITGVEALESLLLLLLLLLQFSQKVILRWF